MADTAAATPTATACRTATTATSMATASGTATTAGRTTAPQPTRQAHTDARSRRAAGALTHPSTAGLAAACRRPSPSTYVVAPALPCRSRRGPATAVRLAAGATPRANTWSLLGPRRRRTMRSRAPSLPGIGAPAASTPPRETPRERGCSLWQWARRGALAFDRLRQSKRGRSPQRAHRAAALADDVVSWARCACGASNAAGPQLSRIGVGAEAWSDLVAIRADAGGACGRELFTGTATCYLLSCTTGRCRPAGWRPARGGRVRAGQRSTACRLEHYRGRPRGRGSRAHARGVAFGDSITKAWARAATWCRAGPRALCERLRQPERRDRAGGVLDAGIGGNRLLAPRMGRAGETALDAMRWT